MRDKEFYVVIPAYEPDEKLFDIVLRLKKEYERMADRLHISVVDDGSGPAYQDVFAALEPYARVLHHPMNRGKGAALKTAFSDLLHQNPKDGVVIIMDADGQHLVEDVFHLGMRCALGSEGVYLGSRHFVGNVPLRSKLGNRITRRVFALVSGVDISDTQTGMRAFPTSYLQKMLEIPGNRYEYEMRMLLDLVEQDVPIREIPIDTVYENNNECSHFNAVRDSARIYRVIMGQVGRFAGASLSSFVIDYVMYAVLVLMGAGVTGANIIARIISAGFNYILNRKLVFKSREHLLVSLVKYAGLAAGILVLDTALLRGMTEVVGVAPLLAKVIVEPCMFLLSWSIQKTYVFGKSVRSRRQILSHS